MAIFLVETWLVKEGKEEEHEEVCKKVLEYIKMHREYFKELKSVRYLKGFLGGEMEGKCVWIQEYACLADMEKTDEKMIKDKTYSNLIKDWKKLIEKHGVKNMIWFDGLRNQWIEK